MTQFDSATDVRFYSPSDPDRLRVWYLVDSLARDVLRSTGVPLTPEASRAAAWALVSGLPVNRRLSRSLRRFYGAFPGDDLMRRLADDVSAVALDFAD